MISTDAIEIVKEKNDESELSHIFRVQSEQGKTREATYPSLKGSVLVQERTRIDESKSSRLRRATLCITILVDA